MNPNITVVVTVYNVAPYLPRFLESMKNQTYDNYRLLVIDDGSTDDSLRILRSYAEADERIVIHTRPHEGISAARNYSTEHLDTEYTVHADGDDYVEPDYLLHLVRAIEKHSADWAISREAFLREGQKQVAEDMFPAYGETCVKRKDFASFLPLLLKDERLNHLYGKIFKTEYFKTILVEPDVKQGSDTMINCRYLEKISLLVVTDDLDYHHILYPSRSVTSYTGDEGFARLCRINRFVSDSMERQGFLTAEMQSVIDYRVLLSGVWTVERILKTVKGKAEQASRIDAVLSDPCYIEAYTRAAAGTTFELTPIAPQSGKAYLKALQKERRLGRIKAAILAVCPKFIKEWRQKRRNEQA